MSPLTPHDTVEKPPVEDCVYQVPLVGRHTVKSLFPSASHSPLTGMNHWPVLGRHTAKSAQAGFNGYELTLDSAGRWQLRKDALASSGTVERSGTVAAPGSGTGSLIHRPILAA